VDFIRINTAVNSLLDACFASNDPVETLYCELERLRTQEGWKESEIRQVQIAALRTLRSITERPLAASEPS
jgi:hypothetical protein